MTAVPLIFVFIEWFSRRVNEVFRCRGGNVPCSRIVSVEALYFLLLVVCLLSLWFSLVYYFLCVCVVRALLVSLFVCLYSLSFPRCSHLETRVGGHVCNQ